MNNRRENTRKQMIQRQITEVRTAIVNMEDALNVAKFNDDREVRISTTICSMAMKNLQDLEKKYLIGQVTEE